jgi:hypothetical protein
MDTLHILDQIAASMTEDGQITDEGFEFIVSCLKEPGTDVVAAAIGLIRLLHKSRVVQLTSVYHRLPLQTQRVLIPVLGTFDTAHQIYRILFDELTMSRDPIKVSLLIETLGRTPFPIFPFILKYLAEANLEDRKRIIEVIKRQGLSNFGPLLAVFPEIPEENAFRLAFGNAAIDAIMAAS